VARVGHRWILCLGRPPPYVPEVGKGCSGLMPIVCPIRRQRRSLTVTCIAGGTASGGQCAPCRGRYSPTHGWVRPHPLGHHDAGLHWQPGTHRERVSRPAPLRRTDTRQDHPHCLTTQHFRGHTCPRRTALAVSQSAADLDQLRWPAEAVCRSAIDRATAPRWIRREGGEVPRDRWGKVAVRSSGQLSPAL
jgi:hypothetical protein